MNYFPSSSCSDSLPSYSSYSLASTSLSNRLETVFKKAWELSILCGVEVCVIYYGPDGELKTWPEEREKVKDMAFRYSQLHEAKRCKKRVDLNGFLNKKQNKGAKHFKKKKKKKKTMSMSMRNIKYPISDHYSPDQISGMIRSLELSYSTLQERLGFVEAQKQKNMNLDHQASLKHQNQTQSLNPSLFSLFMYNHGDATFSQIPLSASNFNLTQFTKNPQDLSGLLQEYELNLPAPTQFTNYTSLLQESGLMNQELHDLDQNMCLSNFNNNNFQHPQQDYTQLGRNCEAVYSS